MIREIDENSDSLTSEDNPLVQDSPAMTTLKRLKSNEIRGLLGEFTPERDRSMQTPTQIDAMKFAKLHQEVEKNALRKFPDRGSFSRVSQVLHSTKKLYKRKGGKSTTIESMQSIKIIERTSVIKKAETALEASNEKLALLESLDSDLSQELPLIRS